MRSLRDLGDFVGLPQDSPEWGAWFPTSLRAVADLLAPVSPDDRHRSLTGQGAIIAGPLPSITLTAQLHSGPTGVEPYRPEISVNAQDGLVISTRVSAVQNAAEFPLAGGENWNVTNFRGAGGRLPGLSDVGPGRTEFVVRRAGVGPGGYVRLEQRLGPVDIRAYRPPPPPQPPPPRPTPEPPEVRPTVRATAAPAGGTVTITVTGSGFLPDRPAGRQGITVRLVDAVRVQDWVHYWTGSGPDGKISLTVEGVDTANLSRNAAGQAIVTVSATDKRRDPSSRPANEPLWSAPDTLRF